MVVAMPNTTAFKIECIHCRSVITIYARAEDVERYKKGGILIQDALPYIEAHDREMFQTQTCKGCWDSLFAEED